ncbi:catalase family peroxidase [Nocardia alni]|uniref:catalase family peroxidase n=1 Tax=Nocardia alni TaxID=2815723 RepID=UPI001C248C8B|nr:catalase family peroxidase [Nocardia alni]
MTAHDTPVLSAATHLIDTMERMSGGPYPGCRRSGARGACFSGTFTPTGAASALTAAAHLHDRPVPVTVRFSNSEGNPHTPDTAAVTRGMATRFHLPDGSDTDLLAITVPRFVASTPQEFLGLTDALRPDPATGVADQARVREFIAAHPHLAEPIMQHPPIPVSYGTATYWAIHAFIWVTDGGGRRPVRFRWEPEARREELTDAEIATSTDDYMTTEFDDRLRRGAVEFTLRVQLGERDDPTHDPTVAWPDERREIVAGRLELTAPVDDQKYWDTQAFNPTRITEGIELSDDPVLKFRAHAYAESLHRRRAGR